MNKPKFICTEEGCGAEYNDAAQEFRYFRQTLDDAAVEGTIVDPDSGEKIR